MVDVLENPNFVYGLRGAYGCKFGFKKVGPCCNAYRPRDFTQAECEIQPILCGRGVGGVSVQFATLFETGFRLISQLKFGKLKYEEVEGHFKNAFEILNKFLTDINIHEKSLSELLKNGDNPTDCCVIAALAEHLLGQLAPGQSYTIDKRCKDTTVYKLCKCGCGAMLKFGDTGIGHEEVWHGFVDIMISSHDGIEPETAVVLPVTKKPIEALDQKKSELNIDESENSDSDTTEGLPVVVKIDSVDSADNDDQTIAQSIVFSLLQKKRHPELRNFLIPTIVMSSTKFRIIMYDAENDVLLRSNSYDLFNTEEWVKLSPASIVTLWMVLHYRIFCSGINRVDLNEELDINDVKSSFLDELLVDCVDTYTSKLKSCVPSFPKVERKTIDTLGENPFLCESYEFWI